MDVTVMPFNRLIETLQVKLVIGLGSKDRASVIASLDEVLGLVWHKVGVIWP
jgi:hypothetical protein